MTCCSCMCRCGVVTAVAGLPHTTTINRSVECVLGKRRRNPQNQKDSTCALELTNTAR